LDGLSHIKADRMNPPQGPLLSRALELLQFPDADIREEAVAALALHWQCKDALPVLSEMLKGGESDQVVLEIAARAVSVYAGQDMCEKNVVLAALAAIVLNFKSDPELRGIAYLSALRVAERITDIDWARTEEDIEELDVDWEWLKRLITGSHKKLP